MEHAETPPHDTSLAPPITPKDTQLARRIRGEHEHCGETASAPLFAPHFDVSSCFWPKGTPLPSVRDDDCSAKHICTGHRTQSDFFFPMWSRLIDPGPCTANSTRPPMIDSVWKK